MLYDLFDMEGKPKDAPALIADTGVELTYGALAKQLKSLGKVLAGYADAKTDSRADAKADSHAGDRLAFDGKQTLSRRSLVFCMCKNEPGAVVGYLGAMAAGCVPLLLSADLKEAQLASFYEAYQPAYIWAPEEWWREYQTIPQIMTGQGKPDELNRKSERWHSQNSAGDENEMSHVSARMPFGNAVYEAYGYGLWATGSAPYEMHPDLALLLATSGSTGDPKLVRLSRKNLRANAASICEYLELDETERPITTLPMQYTYGLSVINSHLLAGAAILMTTAGYVQKTFWDFFERRGATSFGGVPYTYEILKKIHFFQKKPPSLRTMTQAGGKLPVFLQKELAQWARAQNVRFFVMYGQTEATARMGYLPPEMCLEKPGSMGIAIPGGRFWLADENGREISGGFQEKADLAGGMDAELENQWTAGKNAGKAGDGYSPVGELVYEGENVSLGYAACAADLRRGDDCKGVLYTGDLARRDAEGCYFIVGRRKRFVKIFGVRVSLDACEQALRGWYPGVELACAGSDDCLNIYFAGAAYHKRAEAENPANWEDAPMRLADYLHLNRKAFRLILLEEFPKNDAGKILYRELSFLERD